MRLGLKCVVAVVCVVLLSGFGASIVSAPTVASGATIPLPRSGGSSPKIHLVEQETGLWCTWCGFFDPESNRAIEEWGDNAVLIAYHGYSTGTDPFYDTAVDSPRLSFYNSPYYPTTVIDGGGTYGNDSPLFLLGSQTTKPASYDWFRSALETRTDASSNVRVTVGGDLSPTTATVTVTVFASDPVPQTNLYVRTVLYEANVYAAPQVNGPPFHQNVARALNEQPLTITMGQTVTKTATFTLNSAWNLNNLGVGAFVQSNAKQLISISGYTDSFYVSDVLNAAKYQFVPHGIVYYPGTGTTADYAEVYEQVLARTQGTTTIGTFTVGTGENFETYNSNVPGMDTGTSDIRNAPPPSLLAASPGLIWTTGGRVAPILTASDQSLLTSYLDGGNGNLLVTGDGLGFDGWTNYRTFYQSYFHATYNGDNTGVFTVSGTAGDPLGGPFSSTTLALLGGSSPDRVTFTGANAAVPFAYTGGLPGSVRAQHDADSRVVYLGFQYFENSADANRPAVMKAILDYLDGAAPPSVSMVYPAGGEQFAQGSSVDLKWTASDIRIPSNGIDLYWSSDGGTTWNLIASGEPNDGLYTPWTVPNLDSAQCRIKVVAHDSAGLSAEAQSGDFVCGNAPPPAFTLAFTGADLGWHLISYPTQVADTSRASVLSTMSGCIGVVRTYNPLDASDPWVTYDPAKPWNRLTTIDNTQGFWANITAPCTWAPGGSWPTTPTSIALHQGWNLVGFPSRQTTYTVADLKTATGATHVEMIDRAAPPYYLAVAPDTTTLLAGQAYWVYVPADTTWAVPA